MTHFRSRVIRCASAALYAAIASAATAGAQPPAQSTAIQTLTLRAAITRAQEGSVEALAALKTRDAARLADRRFSAGLLPQVSLTATVPSYNRSIIPVIQPDGSTLFRSQQQNNSSLTMNVSQQLPLVGGNLFVRSGLSRLDLSGERQSRSWSGTPFQVGITQPLLRSNPAGWDAEAQGIRVDLAERQYLEAKEDVAIAAMNAFFDAYSAKITYANALVSAAIFDTLYQLNKGRYEVGRIGPTDLQQGQLQYLRAQSAVDAALLERDRTMALLRLQLQFAPDTPIDVVAPTEIPDVAVDTAIAVQLALRNGSPMRNLDLQELEARRRTSEAVHNNGITASLQASIGYNQTAPIVSQVYEDMLQSRQISLSVTMPVIQWGARGAGIAIARLDEERVLGSTKQSRERAAIDAHFAAMQLAQSRRQLGLAAQADSVSETLFDVARRRYAIGRISLQDLLNAQSSRDQAIASYLQARRGYWAAYFRLRRVTLYDFETGAAIR